MRRRTITSTTSIDMPSGGHVLREGDVMTEAPVCAAEGIGEVHPVTSSDRRHQNERHQA